MRNIYIGYYLFSANILMWSESKIIQHSPDSGYLMTICKSIKPRVTPCHEDMKRMNHNRSYSPGFYNHKDNHRDCQCENQFALRSGVELVDRQQGVLD